VIYYKKVREVTFVDKIPKAPSGKILRKEVTFVDKIPKAPSGKILRKELRKQFQQQQRVV
jgi:acyl-coenzyme A synthetase/AMP-(fatty) acid ligase